MAFANVTFHAYNPAGQQHLAVDALNRMNRFEFDAAGRTIKTIFHDGTFTTNIFNNLGQRTGVKDQADRLTQFAYDPSGQLTNVTKPQVPDPVTGDSVWPVWSYEYDVYGRLRATADPNDHSTTNTYDEFGRSVSRLLPLGGWGETNRYNSKGQLTNHYDFKGQRLEFRYDHLGRVTNKFYFATGDPNPSNSVRYIFNHLGQLTNITEKTGSGASSGYAWLGNGNGKMMAAKSSPLEEVGAVLGAVVGGVPPGGWGGLTAVVLCGLAWSLVPREQRRRVLAAAIASWRAGNELPSPTLRWRVARPELIGRDKTQEAQTGFACAALRQSLRSVCSFAAMLFI